MSGINKCILIGRLGTDPKVRYTTSGTGVATFSMATSETWKEQGVKQERTEWHKIVLWKKLAEVAKDYLHKGSLVYIEGRIQTRSYDKDGAKQYITEIVGNSMQMLEGKKQNGNPSDHEDLPSPVEEDDDIPF